MVLSLKEHGHDYQVNTIRACIKEKHLGLIIDMGLGKTMMILHTIANLKRKGKLKKGTLIIAPILVMYHTWPTEIKKWAGTQDLTFSIIHGSNKKTALNKSADIHIINFEGLKWLRKELSSWKQWPWEMLVVDESTKLKDPSTLSFKSLKPMIKLFDRTYILTATLIPQHLYDIWSQWYIVEPEKNEFFGSNFNKWRSKYFYNYSRDVRYRLWSPETGTKQAIQEAIKPKAIRLKADDYLNLPKLISTKTEIEFPKNILKQYQEFEQESILELGGEEYLIDNETVLNDKLRQFTQGAIYTETGSHDFKRTQNFKFEVLKSKIESLVSKKSRALITINYWFEAKIISEMYPECKIIAGDIENKIPNVIPSNKCGKILDQWNEGKLPYLFVHPAAVSHGLNLQDGGNYLLFYSMPNSLDQYLQLIGRLFRQGQTKPVFVDHLIVLNTVDEKTYAKSGERFQTQDDILEYLNGNPAGRERPLLK